jgi:hypothetical protein
VNLAMSLLVMDIPGMECMKARHILLLNAFIGPNTPMSKGCVRWLECGETTDKIIFLSDAHVVSVRER